MQDGDDQHSEAPVSMHLEAKIQTKEHIIGGDAI